MNGFTLRGPDFPSVLRVPQDEREILRMFCWLAGWLVGWLV
ncbi:hypothetical protein Thivi_1939 [Thiocystis violascens DSM 198]|uniref:Uncharacterized protein n=1 Tax=Thiocystis violascens (strain ATCC 17096 / DSM 198 / 6111) TaxID=765911 RepID=G4E0Q4_THIV6|nr:hypothetical protein Thivi_1939 [Thiocystis violascens DSM 198]